MVSEEIGFEGLTRISTASDATVTVAVKGDNSATAHQIDLPLASIARGDYLISIAAAPADEPTSSGRSSAD